MTSGVIKYNALNGHYYEYVPGSYTWQQAKELAEARSYNGLNGYLATLTSKSEDDLVKSLIPDEKGGWLGASDETVDGRWLWVTGPEAGVQFWQGGADGTAIFGNFAAWGRQADSWGGPGNEPNNDNSGNGDFLEIIGGYGWNDRAGQDLSTKGQGYFVEYSSSPKYNALNGHYYEYVPGSYTWQQAKELAEARSYNGLNGYLATLTSKSEDDLVKSLIPDEKGGWLGASDETVDGRWLWVTGPEAGVQFWQGGADGTAIGGNYAAWARQADSWGGPGNEPNNDYQGNGDFLEIIGRYGWNDRDDLDLNSKGQGYVIEFSVPVGMTPKYGTYKNDKFLISERSNHIDGFEGTDVVQYLENASSMSIGHTNGMITVVKSYGNDVLFNIERIIFSDKVLAIDIDGNAGQAYRLYQAALDRTPDERGLAGWIKFMDEGGSLTAMSQQFIDSQEFKTKYGALDNSKFVNQLYLNVLDRNGEPAGIAGWVNGLANGLSRAEVLKGFSESSENQANVIGQIKNGIPYVEWWLA